MDIRSDYLHTILPSDAELNAAAERSRIAAEIVGTAPDAARRTVPGRLRHAGAVIRHAVAR